MLAPVDGDTGARANESGRILLAQAESDAVEECMRAAGFGEYSQLPVVNARDLLRAHPELVSPAKLESRGLVVAADPTLDDVPPEAQEALGSCNGESSAKSASAKTSAYITYRDSASNPLGSWPKTVRNELTAVAQSDDAETDAYRECFRQLGVPADVARHAPDAVGYLIQDMNDRSDDVTPADVAAWVDGEGVLDADGGTLARQAAGCYRTFEVVLTPRLEKLRDDAVEENRERLMEGQDLFYQAIGSRQFDPGGYDF